jgi:hypothetical protein
MPELTLTSPYVQSRRQHIYHGQPYGRVDLNHMLESTLSPSQGLWIWSQLILFQVFNDDITVKSNFYYFLSGYDEL